MQYHVARSNCLRGSFSQNVGSVIIRKCANEDALANTAWEPMNRLALTLGIKVEQNMRCVNPRSEGYLHLIIGALSAFHEGVIFPNNLQPCGASGYLRIPSTWYSEYGLFTLDFHAGTMHILRCTESQHK